MRKRRERVRTRANGCGSGANGCKRVRTRANGWGRGAKAVPKRRDIPRVTVEAGVSEGRRCHRKGETPSGRGARQWLVRASTGGDRARAGPGEHGPVGGGVPHRPPLEKDHVQSGSCQLVSAIPPPAPEPTIHTSWTCGVRMICIRSYPFLMPPAPIAPRSRSPGRVDSHPISRIRFIRAAMSANLSRPPPGISAVAHP